MKKIFGANLKSMNFKPVGEIKKTDKEGEKEILKGQEINKALQKDVSGGKSKGETEKIIKDKWGVKGTNEAYAKRKKVEGVIDEFFDNN